MRKSLDDLTIVFDRIDKKIMLGRRNRKNDGLCLEPAPVDVTDEVIKAVACACYCADENEKIINLLCPNGEKLRLSLTRENDEEW